MTGAGRDAGPTTVTAVEVVLIIGIAGLWVLAGVLVLHARRRDSPSSSELVPAAGSEIDVRDTPDAIELWWPGGGRLATVRPSTAATAGRVLRSPWARRAVTGLLRRAPGAVSPGRRYRITFPPDLMSTMAAGGSVDVVLGGGRAAVAAGPAGALAAGAVTMAVVQQQRLDRTLAVIDRRLELVVDRLRDDDHGRLDAAEALVHQLERRVSELPAPHLQAELAAARHSVEAVYFARRRFSRRLGEAIGDAQHAAVEDGGEMQAWAAGVLDAVGEPDDLRSELLVYLRAVVVRARLATSASEVLALDGHVVDANRLLIDTVAELRADIGDLRRRLGPLARFAPRRALPWKRREWERAHQIVAEVYELMEGEVEPSLPEAEPGPLAIEAAVGDDGEVTDVSVIE